MSGDYTLDAIKTVFALLAEENPDVFKGPAGGPVMVSLLDPKEEDAAREEIAAVVGEEIREKIEHDDPFSARNLLLRPCPYCAKKLRHDEEREVWKCRNCGYKEPE
jgi:hypothetical protein